ncbi:hypothetical protein BV210_15745 [Halorientalis sp. IM1011]|uniref:DUF7344 domain-containing protein n=1 Tax=Halorientalis sp. IM1011 TaxID=1932360 RepID=UPI00097CCA84|nr:hypothetical protein [Halorientalis sp. IM1011]AQL44065.1 hypothetical protein BV210_15745 [Halorientalis sp. IM1011]
MTSKAPVQLETDQAEPRTTSQLFTVLADSRRRRILSLLDERRGGVTEPELATLVASEEADVPLRTVSDDQHERALVRLQHDHLPALESAGLVDRSGTTVRTAYRTEVGRGIVERILDIDGSPADTMTTLDLLASEHRRLVIQYLRAEGEATVDDLVSAISETSDRNARISLLHTHLPKLADAGVIADDERSDDRYLVYEGLPLDDTTVEELIPVRNGDTPDDTVDEGVTGTAESSVRTLEGRDAIVGHGQSLFDRADDELFVMITTDGLLDPACLDGLRDAIDRGVDVYLGSQTQAVRDTIREEVPGATIWEPQRNWIDLPPTRDRLGRLVFADRESVMLGTVGESGEHALVGNGEDDALVILLRELLGDRLDHLDGQSGDVLAHLPL